MWVRGLKHILVADIAYYYVAPYVGAWIETFACARFLYPVVVAPYVGAWIETTIKVDSKQLIRVAPYVGAWIETLSKVILSFKVSSHPMWVRGLKH